MPEPKNVSASATIAPKLAFVSIALLAAIFFGCWFARTDAFKLATTHQPERFTELYFAEPNKLPAKVTAGKTYTSDFAIVNHDATAQTYAYQVTITYPDGTVQVQEAVRVTLGKDQRLTPHFSYTVPNPGKMAIITVSLVEEQQSIHFKVES